MAFIGVKRIKNHTLQLNIFFRNAKNNYNKMVNTDVIKFHVENHNGYLVILEHDGTVEYWYSESFSPKSDFGLYFTIHGVDITNVVKLSNEATFDLNLSDYLKLNKSNVVNFYGNYVIKEFTNN